jgi:hypothetical protein
MRIHYIYALKWSPNIEPCSVETSNHKYDHGGTFTAWRTISLYSKNKCRLSIPLSPQRVYCDGCASAKFDS